jgi:hypothetical protein
MYLQRGCREKQSVFVCTSSTRHGRLHYPAWIVSQRPIGSDALLPQSSAGHVRVGSRLDYQLFFFFSISSLALNPLHNMEAIQYTRAIQRIQYWSFPSLVDFIITGSAVSSKREGKGCAKIELA